MAENNSNVIRYASDEFKCIDRIPEFSKYHHIYVAKKPHVDDDGNSFQVINTKWGHKKVVHPIASWLNKGGYREVILPRIGNKLGKHAKVHRLAFLTWCPQIPENYNELVINHLDENPLNNRLENLELVTAYENNVYGTRLKKVVDTMIRTGKTTKVVAINIRTREKQHFDSVNECARRLGLNGANICHCLAKRRRQHKGYVFCKEVEYSEEKVEELIANVIG